MRRSNSMKYAPVVMFVYNRADHFEETYRALSKCPEAKESELFIFSDGYKEEKEAPKVLGVRKALYQAEKEKLFKTIHIIESPVNKGLAKSIITGVTEVIKKYGKVIVLEDDCVASPYFLTFMNRCLQYYEGDKTIGSIAGYSPELIFPEDYSEEVFLAYRSCSWGWATWQDRWDGVDWRLENIQKFYQNPQLIRKFNSCGNDRFMRLHRQVMGDGSSWSVRFGVHLVIHDWLTVYPRYSYIRNIGCDLSGVHSKREDADSMRVDLNRAIADPNITSVRYDSRIQKRMKRHYSNGKISDLKRLIATIGIICKRRLWHK